MPPLLVWIHGGGWSKGSKTWCPLAWLTGHGFAVASVQYRLSGQAVFPAQIHDCKGAVRWLRAHAGKHGYDASRIGVAGISAGGHLASLLGVSSEVKDLEGVVGGNLDQPSGVHAVVAICGTSDFLMILRGHPGYADSPTAATTKLFGGAIREKRDPARLASPVSHVTKDDPPLMILHGEDDPIVPTKLTAQLAERYKAAGAPVTRTLIPKGGHAPREFWDDVRRKAVREFFEVNLKNPEAN